MKQWFCCRKALNTRCMFHIAQNREDLCRCDADRAVLVLVQKIRLSKAIEMEKRLRNFVNVTTKEGSISSDWPKVLLHLPGRFVQDEKEVSIRTLIRSQTKRHLPVEHNG